MLRERLRACLAHVGVALHEPEAFALRWHREGTPYGWSVFASLTMTAILGTTTYGMIMGLLSGPNTMVAGGLYFTFAAGIAWTLALPALYILNSLAGSRLRASTTFLAALVTTSWGGLAMIASIPIAWFFTAALPEQVQLFSLHFSRAAAVLVVHVVVFAGVGIAMSDIFRRIMQALEPNRRGWPIWWLVLVAAIGTELFYKFDLFQLEALGWI
ncbi:MAG TPA: hypothetical protein VFE62_29380 [Gemmataceae bacterium]|nr:hypothetical protein [Gemmataceae bacterium]